MNILAPQIVQYTGKTTADVNAISAKCNGLRDVFRSLLFINQAVSSSHINKQPTHFKGIKYPALPFQLNC
ncbi:hypothetical protein A3860_27585 [Niastella vici]|uniref:Uncharacterized protein n=1 Tax=Niastella vici TaxID=1703345 RepID=A0A1V9FVS0_9BACT|nr:hypothetical protein [Niastella vici]OQP62459.1 hypothetical protein A3860_27585 [Niastella vici]